MAKTVLLIGLGRFGRSIAEKLNEMDFQVMAVDHDETRANDVLPIVTDVQIGDSTNETFLRSLGVDNYDLCIVTIAEDFQSSLETTSLLKELGAKKVVARASREVHKKFLLRNGADEVVYPEGQLAAWTVLRYAVDYVQDYIALDENHGIYDIAVPAAWNGRTVGELDIRKKYNLNVLAIRNSGRPNDVVTSETVLEENQTMLILGQWKDIQKCFRL